MKIVLAATGTRGDVQPLLLLALSYKTRDPSVECIILTHSDIIQSLKATLSINTGDIEFLSIGTTVKEANTTLLKGDCNTDSEECTHAPFYDPYRDIEKETSIRVCKDADLIVFNLLFCEMYSVAEYFKLPCVIVSAYLPTTLCPLSVEQLLRKEFPRIFEQSSRHWDHIRLWLWRLFLEDHGAWRMQRLGLDAIPSLDVATSIIFPISRFLYEMPSWYPKETFFIGHLSTNSSNDLPLFLDEFIQRAAKPIAFVGFGSMEQLGLLSHDNVQDIIPKILNCLNEYSIVWQCDHDGHIYRYLRKVEPVHKYLHILDHYIDHNVLFKCMSLVLHHGGIGTIQTCIQLSVSQVILPFSFDQPFWRESLEYRNLAGGVKNALSFSINDLNSAIKQACKNDTRKCICEVAALMQNENANKAAGDIIEKMIHPA